MFSLLRSLPLFDIITLSFSIPHRRCCFAILYAFFSPLFAFFPIAFHAYAVAIAIRYYFMPLRYFHYFRCHTPLFIRPSLLFCLILLMPLFRYCRCCHVIMLPLDAILFLHAATRQSRLLLRYDITLSRFFAIISLSPPRRAMPLRRCSTIYRSTIRRRHRHGTPHVTLRRDSAMIPHRHAFLLLLRAYGVAIRRGYVDIASSVEDATV